MLRVMRRVGIAIGSLVAAGLVSWLVGAAIVPVPGFTWIFTIVLGGLIYRDILLREAPPT